MNAPLVIAGVACTRCPNIISDAAFREGNYFGSFSNGFICCECILKQLEAMDAYGRELSTVWADTPYPCARCGLPYTEGYLVEIDGKLGEICNSCGEWYFRHGGIAKGTEAEWILKLK